MAVVLHQLSRSLVPKICRNSSFSLPRLSPMAVLPHRTLNYTSTAMPDLEEHGALEKPKTRHWLSYNEKIFPPTQPGEEPRPADRDKLGAGGLAATRNSSCDCFGKEAEVYLASLVDKGRVNQEIHHIRQNGTFKAAIEYVCHMKENIKYSPKKMWYVASFVRGMSVEEALKQLDYINRKGALAVKETIIEAQQLALEKHNVEFKSNLWIAESFASKGVVIKGMRRHARKRFGTVEYRYCHYFVRLEEGKPPENYYQKPVRTKETLLNQWLDRMHNRRVINSL